MSRSSISRSGPCSSTNSDGAFRPRQRRRKTSAGLSGPRVLSLTSLDNKAGPGYHGPIMWKPAPAQRVQPGGQGVVGGVGAEWQDAPARRTAGADRLGRRGGAAESGAGRGVGDQSTDGTPVAAAVRGGRGGGAAQGCTAAQAPEAPSAGEGGSDRGGDLAHDPAGRDALERAHVGEAPAGESGDGAPDLVGAQSPAPSRGDVHAEPRPG